MRLELGLMLLCVLLVVSLTLAVSLGPIRIPPQHVWQIAAYKLGYIEGGTWSRAHENIVWLIRFPRVILAIFVGAGLAVVGVCMQALVRNPLADPYILGISSGASVGAVAAIGLGVFAFAGIYAVTVAAFIGAMLTFAVVFTLAQQRGQLFPQRMILAGVGAAYVFSGITSFITLTSDNRFLAGQVLSWTLGSLARANWVALSLPSAVLVLGVIYLSTQIRQLNALLIGDESATGLGINVNRFRQQLFVVVSLLTGVMVAVSGAIGFVGLMIPHAVRLLVGSDHRTVLPISVFAGSIFLIWVDVIARTAFAPVELPVGVITSVLGGPFFLWLMWRQAK